MSLMMNKRSDTAPSPILIVEDSEDDMEAVSRALKKTGIANSIEHAWTAEEALDYLRSPKNPKPCMVLLDLNMPGMGGRRALEVIKKDQSTLDVPVIVLTTSNYDADIEACYALGANTYIQKPLSFDDLCVSIKNVTEYWLGTALLPPLRKERERAMILQEQKEAAEKASHIKSDFLASMSHELRTPLNSIIGMTRILYEDASLGEEHRTMVGVVHRSAGGLLVIVNDILDLSKVEAGQIELESIPFSLEEVMHNVIDTMTPLCNDKNLRLVTNFAREGLPYLTGDPTRLSRLMINLLGNAIKYTEKGTITVDVRLEKKESASKNTYALIWSVTDTGIGIPEDRIEHIFDRFAQADATITRRYGGTGLGLTITRQIVEKMGGAIGVESAVDKGSRFWFRVPFEKADIEPGTRKKATSREASLARLPASLRKKATQARLLVADDHPLNQAFMQKLLPRLGISSLAFAETGKEVVEAFEKGVYDVILLDCHMPVMSGYEAVEAIRKAERAKNKEAGVPVIAMTADAMTGTRERCLASGMNDYISKPIDSDELKLVLSQWLTFEDEDGDDVEAVKSETSPIDLRALRRFISNEGELSELLVSFTAQFDEAVKLLKENSIAGESNAWNAAASKIRNSSAIIKAEELQLLAKRAETLKNASAADRERLAQQIADAWVQVRRILKAL